MTDENTCPAYSDGHQFAVFSVEPPKSECQNCGLIVDSLEGKYREENLV